MVNGDQLWIDELIDALTDVLGPEPPAEALQPPYRIARAADEVEKIPPEPTEEQLAALAYVNRHLSMEPHTRAMTNQLWVRAGQLFARGRYRDGRVETMAARLSRLKPRPNASSRYVALECSMDLDQDDRCWHSVGGPEVAVDRIVLEVEDRPIDFLDTIERIISDQPTAPSP